MKKKKKIEPGVAFVAPLFSLGLVSERPRLGAGIIKLNEFYFYPVHRVSQTACRSLSSKSNSSAVSSFSPRARVHFLVTLHLLHLYSNLIV